MKRNRKLPLIVFSLLCGLLASLPLIFDRIPYLSFVLFVPYFLYLRTRGKTFSLRLYYLSGLFFFFGYYAGAFSFFTAMYPLDFAGLGTVESIAVLFAAMVLLPLFQAWFSAFAILLLGLLDKRGYLKTPLLFSLSLSALYTLFAYAQNFTWAGVPWASTAVGVASSPLLIQAASLLGSDLLVFLVILVNAALVEAFLFFRACEDRRALICLVSALVLVFSQTAFGAIRLALPQSTERPLTVAVIQGNSSKTGGTLLSRLSSCAHEARKAAKAGDVDLMLWSESVLTYALERDGAMWDFFSDVAKETDAIQVIGAFSRETTEEGEEGYFNALFLFYPDGTAHETTYKKQRPVPFGEYVPMPWLFEALIPALTEISMLSRDTDAGTAPSLFETEAGVFGGLICFDSIYPDLARESVNEGAQLLLLSTDDSWFDGSFAKSLHFRHAALRAAENGRAVVRTGNTGQSGIIDERGGSTLLIQPDLAGYGVGTVALRDTHTLYSRVGSVLPLLCLIYLVSLPLAVGRMTKKRPKG